MAIDEHANSIRGNPGVFGCSPVCDLGARGATKQCQHPREGGEARCAATRERGHGYARVCRGHANAESCGNGSTGHGPATAASDQFQPAESSEPSAASASNPGSAAVSQHIVGNVEQRDDRGGWIIQDRRKCRGDEVQRNAAIDFQCDAASERGDLESSNESSNGHDFRQPERDQHGNPDDLDLDSQDRADADESEIDDQRLAVAFNNHHEHDANDGNHHHDAFGRGKHGDRYHHDGHADHSARDNGAEFRIGRQWNDTAGVGE
jgi:hypothetical protein